jgi:hypothetical protein
MHGCEERRLPTPRCFSEEIANAGLISARVRKSEGRVCNGLKAMSEESALLRRRIAKRRRYAEPRRETGVPKNWWWRECSRSNYY